MYTETATVSHFVWIHAHTSPKKSSSVKRIWRTRRLASMPRVTACSRTTAASMDSCWRPLPRSRSYGGKQYLLCVWIWISKHITQHIITCIAECGELSTAWIIVSIIKNVIQIYNWKGMIQINILSKFSFGFLISFQDQINHQVKATNILQMVVTLMGIFYVLHSLNCEILKEDLPNKISFPLLMNCLSPAWPACLCDGQPLPCPAWLAHGAAAARWLQTHWGAAPHPHTQPPDPHDADSHQLGHSSVTVHQDSQVC